MMDIIWIILVAYFALGLIAIIALDLSTKRVRQRLTTASYATRDKMTLAGSYVGLKTALVITALALWLFWPVAIYGAFKGKEDDNG